MSFLTWRFTLLKLITEADSEGSENDGDHDDDDVEDVSHAHSNVDISNDEATEY